MGRGMKAWRASADACPAVSAVSLGTSLCRLRQHRALLPRRAAARQRQRRHAGLLPPSVEGACAVCAQGLRPGQAGVCQPSAAHGCCRPTPLALPVPLRRAHAHRFASGTGSWAARRSSSTAGTTTTWGRQPGRGGPGDARSAGRAAGRAAGPGGGCLYCVLTQFFLYTVGGCAHAARPVLPCLGTRCLSHQPRPGQLPLPASSPSRPRLPPPLVAPAGVPGARHAAVGQRHGGDVRRRWPGEAGPACSRVVPLGPRQFGH